MAQLIEVGARRRATLTNIGHHDRYLAEELPDGTLVLHPAVVLSQTQARLLAAPNVLAQITKANSLPDEQMIRRPRRKPRTA